MKATDRPRVKILVLGTADWNQPIATNQHYVVRELCEEFDVVYVESMGLRRPCFGRSDIRRILRRMRLFRHATFSGRSIPNNLQIITPLVVPYHRNPVALINKLLLDYQLRDWNISKGVKVLWTYTPVTYRLEEKVNFSIYHCVDLLGEVNGIDSRTVNLNEEKLATSAVRAIGSSAMVATHLSGVGFKDVLVWPNVADLRVFAQETNHARSGALFAGNFVAQKIDYSLLMELVETGMELHLAGPVSDPESQKAIRDLETAGAIYHGLLDLEPLAKLANECVVGLIPYILNGYTVGVSPLKTYEYLAAGLTVVSTDLPGVEEVSQSVRVFSSRHSFVTEVNSLLANHPDPETNRCQAEGHGWKRRGDHIRALIRAEADQ